MNLSFLAINFNFFQKEKVTNVFLNVFISRQIAWMFPFGFSDQQMYFLFNRSLTFFKNDRFYEKKEKLLFLITTVFKKGYFLKNYCF